jgi:hypothetical protein
MATGEEAMEASRVLAATVFAFVAGAVGAAYLSQHVENALEYDVQQLLRFTASAKAREPRKSYYRDVEMICLFSANAKPSNGLVLQSHSIAAGGFVQMWTRQ